MGIARCGLACCLCSENTSCAGCNSGECPNKNWCENRKCSLEEEIQETDGSRDMGRFHECDFYTDNTIRLFDVPQGRCKMAGPFPPLLMPDGKAGTPCGACREYMMQLDRNSGEIEILLDLECKKTVFLKDLIPSWWGGEDRFKKRQKL